MGMLQQRVTKIKEIFEFQVVSLLYWTIGENNRLAPTKPIVNATRVISTQRNLPGHFLPSEEILVVTEVTIFFNFRK